MPIRPGMKPEASKPLAGGQRSATTEKPPQKNHPEGWQLPVCERCPLAGLFQVLFYPQIFADWFYQFFICVPLRHLRIHCSVSDRSPACCVSGRPRFAKQVCGAVSALVPGRDFDIFFCVRVFLFDAVAQFL
jgi:hypothetical protein